MTKEEALKLALEALEKNNNDWKRLADSGDTGRWTAEETELYKQTEQAIISIKEALAKPQQEPVRLRRGNILRCIETNELCTVWSTSTTGKTLVKWGANSFGEYTAEQIGELFWLEPEPDNLELAAEKSDNYASFHAGYRFAVAHHLAQPEQEPVAWWNDTGTHIDLNVSGRGTPLYTHPVKDLEDININITWNENSMRDFGKDELNFARAILRKAQEK